MQTKIIRCRCYGLISAHASAKAPWEDVWLRWKSKPGRRTYTKGTTLKTRAELLVDLRHGRELQTEDPDAESGLVYVAGLEKILTGLDENQYMIGPEADPTYIYTRSPGIDRAEAERMLLFFLRNRYEIRFPQFKWNRLEGGPAIIPVGFGQYGP